MMTLEELAERVQKLDGPDMETDWLIAETLGEIPVHKVVEAAGCDYVWHRTRGSFSLWKALDSEGRCVESWSPKPRTRVLQAAIETIPSGYDYILEHVNGGLTISCLVGTSDEDKRAWGNTDVLAVLVGALRARVDR